MAQLSKSSGRLEGKVAVVTGAGSGFGVGIATRFAAEGARVMIADIDADRAEAVAATIRTAGDSATAIAVDVTDGTSVEKLVAATIAAHGGLDIFVNNAGVGQRYQPVTEVGEEIFDRIFAVNVKSLYWCGIKVVPSLRARGGGVILNTASTSAIRPRPGSAWYNASKSAVLGATRSLAIELAPDRIRVCALCPVAGETPLLTDVLSSFGGEAEVTRVKQQFLATVPLGRLCTPADMANAALFLASDEAAFLTGVCLEVDGGRCI